MREIASENLVIDCPIKEVFTYISNMENFGSWFPEVKSIVSQDDMPHRTVGKMYLEQASDPFKGDVTIPIKVITCQANEFFQTQGDYPPLMPQMTIRLARISASQTAVDWNMSSRNDSFFFGISMLLLVRLVMKKRAKSGLLNLKNLLEQEH